MANKATRAEVNNFIKGLITEASPLNYPANASIDEENFELNRDGTRDRRLGMDYEEDAAVSANTFDYMLINTAKISSYKWISANGITDKDILVIQTENVLKFYDLAADSLSGSGYLGSFALTTFPTNTLFSFSSLERSLIVAAGVSDIAIITYQYGVFSVEYKRILVRDLWGVQVQDQPNYETDPTYRANSGLPPSHYYNLQNQSWGIPRKDSGGTLVDPVQKYMTDLSLVPSASESVWPGLQFQPVTAGVTFERMYTNLYTEVLGSRAYAAKGYYIIDALNRGASRTTAFLANKAKFPTGLLTSIVLPEDKTSGGAKCLGRFAGRIWYAGFSGEVTDKDSRSPDFSNFIFFSQLVKNKEDLVKCYQEGDPSSRDNPDIVDTDGGFLRIEEAKNIIALHVIKNSLIVIASNGVWAVTGGSEYGFTATNYKVDRLSIFGSTAPQSVVEESDRIFFWSLDGIYVVSRNQTGDLVVGNITQTSIQTFYETISQESKENVVGAYDPIAKKIRWLYKSGVRFDNVSSVTKELVLDVVINAFYNNKIGTLSENYIQVVGMFPGKAFNRGRTDSPVMAGTDDVIAGTDYVVVNETVRDTGVQSMRYVLLLATGGVSYITFGLYNNQEFRDFQGTDGVGVDAFAYLLTGQQNAGDTPIAKQVPYLNMFFRRTEQGVDENLVPLKQSGCLMRMQWDFANSIISKKWSALVQVYRYRRAKYVEDSNDDYDTGFSIISSKNKVRGRGKTVALYLETEPYKDCRIVGWSISLKGNSDV